MTIISTLGLALAMFLLAITPGPGVFATVSKALASGFRHTLPVIMGIVVGDLVFLLFAIYGLAAIAETFNALFTVIKYLGAAYLIWLGVRLWHARISLTDITEANYQSGKQSFLGGLSITLGNPKVILFYLGFLPTFVNLGTLATIDVAIVALVVSFVLGSVMLFYAFTASRARLLFKSETAQSRMNKTAGCAMITTGAILLTKT
ncbi:LysE family translocator [Solemya velum gill symbiont]|uniref:Putative threonine efflux protein LysE n=2 Tax=Solemya velum gill symbiont TaxID=2340 RepID=A0A0B0H7K8_SOVGS|nr:LysE family translocator [Solemya velum gill symbiont]KHF25105.1 putative threonine efflux protein LysE [Solemya velum gill symbiont]OOY97619.1 lysine transporter [Solemya velum gill symbiont]OOY99585.1 lysine transporter [Solemya velum gill symbiont]OOZ01904.1 lysine transporter [Solemya velum gill symbiont]OOZ03956.1 lysine transporter [Solemya velum gill symbiont]